MPVLVLLRLLDGDICDSWAVVSTLGHHDLQHSVVHLGLQKCTRHLSELTFGCVLSPDCPQASLLYFRVHRVPHSKVFWGLCAQRITLESQLLTYPCNAFWTHCSNNQEVAAVAQVSMQLFSDSLNSMHLSICTPWTIPR